MDILDSFDFDAVDENAFTDHSDVSPHHLQLLNDLSKASALGFSQDLGMLYRSPLNAGTRKWLHTYFPRASMSWRKMSERRHCRGPGRLSTYYSSTGGLLMPNWGVMPRTTSS
ncbi:hypothetical protein BST61_g1002 [Cercospora zeina]